jgi:hypothetical protein
VLLPRLGPSQHFGQDVLGPDTGIGSVLPQWHTQRLPSGENRGIVRLTDWERRQ